MKKALLLSAIIATAQAQVFEMDQGFDSGASGGNAVLDVQHLGQTFTVGIEGTLHQVQLNLFYVSDPGGSGIMDDLTFWLYRPNGVPVFTQPIPLADIPQGMDNSDMVTVALHTPLDLQLGSQWELRLKSENHFVSSAVNWSRQTGDPYSGGDAMANGAPIQGDHSFFTFMEPGSVPTDNLAAIPEPGTYAALFAVGLLGFALWRRFKPCYR